MPDKSDLKLWKATAIPVNGVIIVSYTCPVCKTSWTINVAKGETETQLWCHNDGNNTMFSL